MNDDYLYVIRNDGRVDRATISGEPTWTESHSDAGSDFSFLGIAVEVPEFSFSIYLVLGLLFVFMKRRKPKEPKVPRAESTTKWLMTRNINSHNRSSQSISQQEEKT